MMQQRAQQQDRLYRNVNLRLRVLIDVLYSSNFSGQLKPAGADTELAVLKCERIYSIETRKQNQRIPQRKQYFLDHSQSLSLCKNITDTHV